MVAYCRTPTRGQHRSEAPGSRFTEALGGLVQSCMLSVQKHSSGLLSFSPQEAESKQYEDVAHCCPLWNNPAPQGTRGNSRPDSVCLAWRGCEGAAPPSSPSELSLLGSWTPLLPLSSSSLLPLVTQFLVGWCSGGCCCSHSDVIRKDDSVSTAKVSSLCGVPPLGRPANEAAKDARRHLHHFKLGRAPSLPDPGPWGPELPSPPPMSQGEK
ncbi:uncharacterized protein LOC133661522 isoform X1 [Entelurus aequoreus]|uniref:uncharacterized protein LOC133661522 isoform X1 n=1 Tax=Entelurus aequoreus TaxID=161455 RepID=UPI002B1D3277|nr:uncharacterized protein LOC133661522 isoform X1 [Entelurus aequoreus]